MSNYSESQTFFGRSKGIYITARIVESACYRFLALTTGIFSYSLFDDMIKDHIALEYMLFARIAGIVLFFLVIDYGLESTIKWYIKERYDKSNNQNRKGNPYESRLLLIVLLLIIIRIVATGTSSVWAAPEVSNVTTSKGKEDYYITQALAKDSLNSEDKRQQLSYLQGLERNEGDRILTATSKGNQLINAAISAGDRWQKKSYKEEGFKWLLGKGNKDKKDHDYGKSIKAAMAQKTALIIAEKERTMSARNMINSTQSDTSNVIVASLTQMAQEERDDFKNRLKNRENYIYLFDIISLIIGLFCSYTCALFELTNPNPNPTPSISSKIRAGMSRLIKGEYDMFRLSKKKPETVVSETTVSKTKTETVPLKKAATRRIGYKLYHETESPKQAVSKKSETDVTHCGTTVTTDETAKQSTVSKKAETAKQSTVSKEQKIKVLIAETDLSDMKRFCSTYYKRSIKAKSSKETRARNREKYLEFKEEIEVFGIEVVEVDDTLKYITKS